MKYPVLLCGLLLVATALPGRPANAGEDKLAVVLYDGFGTSKAAWLSGRVLVDRGLDKPRKNESRWARFRRVRRMLESDEVPGARIEVRVLGRKHALVADDEGLFELKLPGPLPIGRHAIGATLPGRKRQRTLAATLAVFPAKPATAVISDFDDTVVVTDVTRKGRMVRKLATTNALDLKPIAGASKLYGRWAARGWPIIFVSGSPINLQPRLKRFLRHRRIPNHGMMLKHLGSGPGTDALFAQKGYKLGRIDRVMKLLPGWRLILVGDSGEKDPEVYAEIRKRQPKLVQRILIRRVPGDGREAPLPKGIVEVKDWRGEAKRAR